MNQSTEKTNYLDQPNIVNEPFYVNDLKHTISMAISNAINPTFIVYAENLQDALNHLAEYVVKHELQSCYFTHDELFNNEDPSDNIEEDQEESYHQADNGVYLDMNRLFATTEE